MSQQQHLDVSEVRDVTVVRFKDRRILDTANIEELGKELFGLVDKEHRKKLLLDFAGVEFLSSGALNKLIVLDDKVKKAGGKLKVCNLRTEIYEVFRITQLDTVFDVRENETEALESF